MNLSDESAGAQAIASGGRHQIDPTGGVITRKWAVCPATLRPGEVEWLTAPSLLLQDAGPTCDTCTRQAEVLAQRRRPDGVYVYALRCDCGEDEISSEFRLAVGGDMGFWTSDTGREIRAAAKA